MHCVSTVFENRPMVTLKTMQPQSPPVCFTRLRCSAAPASACVRLRRSRCVSLRPRISLALSFTCRAISITFTKTRQRNKQTYVLLHAFLLLGLLLLQLLLLDGLNLLQDAEGFLLPRLKHFQLLHRNKHEQQPKQTPAIESKSRTRSISVLGFFLRASFALSSFGLLANGSAACRAFGIFRG